MGIQQKLYHQKGPAEDVLPAQAQEVQPASGPADPVLHCSHPVYSLHIHQKCRKNDSFRTYIHTDIDLWSQETGRRYRACQNNQAGHHRPLNQLYCVYNPLIPKYPLTSIIDQSTVSNALFLTCTYHHALSMSIQHPLYTVYRHVYIHILYIIIHSMYIRSIFTFLCANCIIYNLQKHLICHCHLTFYLCYWSLVLLYIYKVFTFSGHFFYQVHLYNLM